MFCQKCGKENKDDAGFCIHCGAGLSQTVTVQVKDTVQVKEKVPKTKRAFWVCGIVAAIVVILAIVVPIGICAIIGVSEEQESKALDILNSSMSYDMFGYAEVTGRVKNTSDSEISFHALSAKFYNSADVLIYSGSTYVEDVAAGEVAQFSIMCLEKGAVRYEVSVD